MRSKFSSGSFDGGPGWTSHVASFSYGTDWIPIYPSWIRNHFRRSGKHAERRERIGSKARTVCGRYNNGSTHDVAEWIRKWRLRASSTEVEPKSRLLRLRCELGGITGAPGERGVDSQYPTSKSETICIWSLLARSFRISTCYH